MEWQEVPVRHRQVRIIKELTSPNQEKEGCRLIFRDERLDPSDNLNESRSVSVNVSMCNSKNASLPPTGIFERLEYCEWRERREKAEN
jgi:hypothetical protein